MSETEKSGMDRERKMKIAGVVIAVLLGLGLLLIPQPSLQDRVEATETKMSGILDSREVHVDPAELLGIIYYGNMRLRILDVRKEADYNLFHIVDSKRVTMDQIKDPVWVKKLKPKTVFVLVSNDEKKATEAWKYLFVQKVPNIYILDGGINNWLSIYSDRPRKDAGEDELAYTFDTALGGRHPSSDPNPAAFPKREYETKIESIGVIKKKAGGCG